MKVGDITLAAAYVPGQGYILCTGLAAILQQLDALPTEAVLYGRDSYGSTRPRMTTFAVTTPPTDAGGRIQLGAVLAGSDQTFKAGDFVYLQSVPSVGAGTGTITSIAAGTGLTGGPITASGTISIAPGPPDTLAGYGDSGAFGAVTVGANLFLSGGTLSAVVGPGFTLTTTGSSGRSTFSGGILNIPQYIGGGGGSGTVTTASVASANGFGGTVANPTTAPAITLTTSVTGLLKGAGGALVAATPGTDYQASITLTTTGPNGAATLSGGTLNIPQYAGGLVTVATHAARNAISNTLRLEGMICYTQNTSGTDGVSGYWQLLPSPWTGVDADWGPAGPLQVELAGNVVGSRGTLNLIQGSGVTLTVADDPTDDRVNLTIAAAGAGGTVTSASVASANGFAGTVATATTTPAITLTTSVTGVLKGDGTALAAATPGTDYQAPITLTTTGSSGAATFSGNTLNVPQYGAGTGTVTSVGTGTGLTGGPITGTGTVSIAAGGVGTTQLAASGVTYAKLQSESASTLLGNPTGSAAAPSEITLGSGLSFSGTTLTATGGTGTVTTASVASANGFAGTVANPTTTPAITITTSVTGILKGNGTAISAASAGTDYLSSNQTVTLSGDATGSGATAITVAVAKINGATLGTTTATSGNLLIGSGSQWATQAMSGDASISSTGVVTVSKIGGTSISLPLSAANGGTGQSSYATGDTLYAGGGTAIAKLAGNTTTTKNFLTSTGTGSAANAPSWGTIAAADLPTTGLTITQHAGVIAADTDGATITFNLSTSDWHTVTLGGNRTLALSGATVGQQFSIVLAQDGTGSRTVTWFSGIKWPGGTVPTLTTAAGGIDVFTFKCMSSGVYYGFTPGQAMA